MNKVVTTYFLEMTSPEELRPSEGSVEGLEILQARIPSPELNRFLYTAVGGGCYKARGFRTYRQDTIQVEVPDVPPGPWPGAYGPVQV